MADDQTTDTTAPAALPSGLSQDQIAQLLASLHLGQGLPNVQPDTTPVDSSGFGGGLRHVVSLLGEFAGSPGPETLKALSPSEREDAGIQALSRFGTGLLQASGSGKWIGTNLGNAFATAEQGYDATRKQALGALAAKQGYAVEDQRAQIERLKAALPLLSLQAQTQSAAGARALVGSGAVAPGASIATGGSIAPFVATNLPEGVSTAEDQIVRTVLGEAANQGTAGQQAVAAVIKNRMNAGKQNAQDVIFAANQFEPWNNAKTRAGLEAVDPNSRQYQDVLNNAVRPVMSGSAKDPTGGATHFWSPTAQAALGREPPSWAAGQTPTVIGQHNFYKLPYGAAAPAPGQTAAAPAPVGTRPANTPVTIPPAAAPNAARPSLPPPEAPMAGTAQTAGDVGVPTSGIIPPSPPGSPAAVADIISGMVARGADATTLAPGPGSAPAPMPGAVVTAQAGPPKSPLYPDIKAGDVTIPHPGSFAEFTTREYVPPPKSEDFNPNLTPQQQARFDALNQGIEGRAANLKNMPIAKQAEEADKIIADRAALKAEIQQTAQAKAQAAAAATTKWDDAQRDQIQKRYEKERDTYTAASAEQQKHRNAIDLEQAKVGFNTQAEGQKVLFNTATKEIDEMGKNAVAARGTSNQIQQLTQVLKDVPETSPMSALLHNYPGLTQPLVQAGVIKPGEGTDIQLMQAITSNLSSQLRPAGAGSTSDRDLATYKAALPNLLLTKDGRVKAAAFLQNINDRIVAEHQFAQQYFIRRDPETGKPAFNTVGMPDAMAKSRAEGGLGPIIPHMPTPKAAGTAAGQEALDWVQNNVDVGHPFMGFGYPVDPRSGVPLPVDPKTGKKNALIPQLMIREN